MSNKDKNDLPSLLSSTLQISKKEKIATSKLLGSSKAIPIADLLSEAGRFSFAAILALGLHHLYHNKWDLNFNEKCLRNILKHLKLPKQVDPAMFLLLNGELKEAPAVYIDLLMDEPSIKEVPALLAEDCVLLAVQEGKYDARWRVLIKYLVDQLEVNWDTIEDYERSLVNLLSSYQPEQTEEELKGAKLRERLTRVKRYALIGLASLSGGALIGITGGLAAPLIGAGLGSMIGGTTLFALIGTPAGAAIIASMFGAAGAGLTGYKMHKRVGEIEEFAFGYLSPACAESNKTNSDKKDSDQISIVPIQQQLHITIAVSGWLKDDREDNFTRPWLCLSSSEEQYYLRYESSYLLELGKAMEYFTSIALSMAAQEALKYTILSGLINAVAWPASLLGLASVIDNPWGVCCRRSAQVGKQLAEVLLSREHGQRPVTLVGFSLGARVIYYCLREMSDRSGCEGIIQDAIMIGAPCAGHPDDWSKMTRVVAGRLVNGYCRTDWLLRFLYRTLSMPSGGVAGLQPIELNDRRMVNIDLSDVVSGHSEYPDKIGQILNQVGIKVQNHGITSNKTNLTRSETEIFDKKLSLLDVSPRTTKSETDLSNVTNEVSIMKQGS